VTVLVEAVRARHGVVLDHDALDFHGVCGRCEPGTPGRLTPASTFPMLGE
jgi:hypothetical protein